MIIQKFHSGKEFLSKIYLFFIRNLSRIDKVYQVMCRHNPYKSIDDIRTAHFFPVPEFPRFRTKRHRKLCEVTRFVESSHSRAFLQACTIMKAVAQGVAAFVLYACAAIPAHAAINPTSIGWSFPISGFDFLAFAAVLLIVILIFRLSRGEMRTSISHGHKADISLESERDQLEHRIAERTQEFIAAKKEKDEELERVVQFGRLSQGLFHDLMSPLTSISLYLERLQAHKADLSEADEIMGKAVNASKRMSSFMDSVKKSLGNRTTLPDKSSNVSSELKIAHDILGYKARMAGVQIAIDRADPIQVAVHPVRMQQLFLNLITNSIDSFAEKSSDEKVISISVEKNPAGGIIKLRDNGSGMTEEQIIHAGKKAFTTKPNGTGIGLMTIREIVEKELKGELKIESGKGTGTRFAITFTDHTE